MTTDLQNPADPVAALEQGERAWGELPLPGRIALLSELSTAVAAQARDWVEVASAMKGLPRDSPYVGEEWLSGPYPVLECVAALRESLEALHRGGSPLDGFSCGRAPGGRAWPCGCCRTTLFERLLFSGFEVDVWMPPGVEEATVRGARRARPADARADRGVGARAGRREHHLDRDARRPRPALRPQSRRGRSSSTRSPSRCCRCSSARSRR